MKRTLSAWLPGIILFAVSLCIGLCCYKDYGFAWDEWIQRLIGNTTYDYVFHNNQALKSIEFRDLGTGFELPLIFIEKSLHLTDMREITQMRHLVTHLFFLISVFCGYVLILRLYKSQAVACIGFLMLAFHPRIYAHSYFNSKDIPFLSMFLIAFLVCHIAFDKNKPLWYFILGLACGYTTSIRAMGIMLLPCISLLFLLDMYRQHAAAKPIKPSLRNFGLYVAGFCVMLYIAWPILWSSPIHYFAEEFKRLAHINWGGDVIFMGQSIPGSALPWTYVPVWVAISTPVIWLAAGAAGIVWILMILVTKPASFFPAANSQFLLYLACLLGPVIMVIALRSVNYDDWRHLYFIYPSFVLIALYPVAILMKTRARYVVYWVFAMQIIYVGLFIKDAHPFEYVYFNSLVAQKDEELRKNYDMEYWCTSYRKGLEYILTNDPAPVIRVSAQSGPINENVAILTKEQRKRIVVVDEHEHPDYFITNFRTHADDYNYPVIFYNVKVLNSTILRIYKTKSTTGVQ